MKYSEFRSMANTNIAYCSDIISNHLNEKMHLISSTISSLRIDEEFSASECLYRSNIALEEVTNAIYKLNEIARYLTNANAFYKIAIDNEAIVNIPEENLD